MGAQNSQNADLGSFPIEQYRRPGMNDEEIRQLYSIFQSLGPSKETGFVKASRVKQQYQESMNKSDFDH